MENSTLLWNFPIYVSERICLRTGQGVECRPSHHWTKTFLQCTACLGFTLLGKVLCEYMCEFVGVCLCMCVCTSMCVHMNVCLCACVHIHLCVYECGYLCMCLCICVYTYMPVCICVHGYVHVMECL